MPTRYIVGVDIGGTFTDCVLLNDEGDITIGKSLSTPQDFSLGVIDAARDAAHGAGLEDERELLARTRFFFHACTVAENALFTRSGAKTGLIATRGFGEASLMMRGKTAEGLSEAESRHSIAQVKPDPLVPKGLIQEITERVDYKGAVIWPAQEEDIEQAAKKLLDQGVESVAVALLWSPANNAHEKMVGDVLGRLDPAVFTTLSSDLVPYIGEYARSITTIINAYIGPQVSTYLVRLSDRLREEGLQSKPYVMQAYGGVVNMQEASRNAVGTVESGPAAGVVGSQFLGNLIGERDILATDMGGTTFKASTVDGGVVERDLNPLLLRFRLLSSKIAVKSLGAGGGSIAWIDPESGLPKVGPNGAGAFPGPVCYGRGGTEPTVSDVDLVLGYLSDKYFMGGQMQVDKAASMKAIEEKLAQPLGVSAIEAASGVYRIVNAHMSDLLREVTVERGRDPRDYTLFGFGGAAGMHVSRYAADLGVKLVIVPATASVHSAVGLVASDIVHEFGKSDHLLVPLDIKRGNATFADLVGQGLEQLTAAGFDKREVQIVRSVDMRYRNQMNQLNVTCAPGHHDLSEEEWERLYESFDTLYEQVYGRGAGYPEAGKEIVNFRIVAVGSLPRPKLRRAQRVDGNGEGVLKELRPVFFQENMNFVDTPVYNLDQMVPGTSIKGPAILESRVTSVVINPNDASEMDEYYNLRISVNQNGV